MEHVIVARFKRGFTVPDPTSRSQRQFSFRRNLKSNSSSKSFHLKCSRQKVFASHRIAWGKGQALKRKSECIRLMYCRNGSYVVKQMPCEQRQLCERKGKRKVGSEWIDQKASVFLGTFYSAYCVENFLSHQWMFLMLCYIEMQRLWSWSVRLGLGINRCLVQLHKVNPLNVVLPRHEGLRLYIKFKSWHDGDYLMKLLSNHIKWLSPVLRELSRLWP